MNSRNKSKLRMLAAALLAVLLAACAPASALAASFSAIVTAQSMPVYVNDHGKVRQASLPKDTVVTVGKVRDGMALISYNGSRVKVAAGTVMSVLAVNGSAVMVEYKGAVGYALRKHLLFQSEATQSDIDALKQQMSAQQTPKLPSVYDAFKSGNYSTEQLCYLFLIQVMGYNTAAAAGVLANINYESGFKTAINGDGGTSYGLCQWHASRKTRLINYCSEHGVSADSLVGQLAYLKYELENFYPLVHRYLKGVSNTAEGAYDAAYFFCYNFENPASRESKSVTRGQSAQKTYFPRYASI